MSDVFFDRVQEVFADALEQPPADRAAFLDAACAGAGADADADAVRLEVEALLAAHDAAGEYLAEPTMPGPDGGPDTTAVAEEQPGATIGRYVLRERLGEGGFGTVYLAEQQRPLQRDVALKVIKVGMDTRQVVARFEAERQALAVMDHPGIAKVLDAGATPTGRPYFVMELVRGESITAFCDTHALSIPQRLELFQHVCLAVQHAHQKGVVHRDLKPSNILVSMVDGRPAPKVIDFGIAKAMRAAMGAPSLMTLQGQLIGTPEYMSPEQAGLHQADIDTRTDIYALGVLLYQLLTGALPFDPDTLRSGDVFEIRRRIREVEPPKPSTKLRQMAEHDSSAAARMRNAEGQGLIRRLRGDLDWITMKAMAKERERRYTSANELADDVQRHLAGEPVRARPPSMRYLAGKFMRRHQRAVASAAALLLVLIGGIVATSWSMIEAQRQRDAAERLAYTATIAAAASSLATGDHAVAAAQLDRSPPALRGWEWQHLHARMDNSMLAVDMLDALVSDVAVTPDGAHLLIVGDGFLHVADRATGQVMQRIALGDRGWTLCSLGPAGDRALLSSIGEPSDPESAALWMLDLTTGRRLWRLEGAVGGRYVFSEDGTLVAVALPGEGAVAWVDARTGSEVARREITSGSPSRVAMTPDGEIMFLASDSGVAGIVGREGQPTMRQGGNVFLRSVFAPRTGSLLWDVWTDGRVVVADLQASGSRNVPARPGHERMPLAWSADGRWIALGEESRVLIWNAEKWTLETVLLGHDAGVTTGRFSRDGDLLVTGDRDGVVRTWTMPPTHSPWLVEHWESWTRDDASVSPDTRTMATVGWSFVRLWNLPEGTVRTIVNEGSRYVQQVAFSPDGRWVAACGRNRSVHLIDADTGEVHLETEFIGNQPLAWTPDATAVLWRNPNGAVEWIDAETGRTREPLRFDGAPIQLIETAGQRLVALACPEEPADSEGAVPIPSRSGFLVAWDLSDRRLTHRISGLPTDVVSLALDRTGQLAAIGAAGGDVAVWDLDAGTQRWRSAVGPSEVDALAFSRDGTRLAVGRVGAIDLLDADTGELKAMLRHRVGRVVGLAFTDGDRSLVACGHHHPLVVFDATVDAETRRRRSRFRQGRLLADPLFGRFRSSRRVVEHLHAQPDLPEWTREAAIEYATARGDHLAAIASNGSFAIQYEKYDAALSYYHTLQEHAGASAPRWGAICAYAHYKLGQYDDAHAALQSYIDWPDRTSEIVPSKWALSALISHHLGHADASREALQRAQDLALSIDEQDDVARDIWGEAAALFGDMPVPADER